MTRELTGRDQIAIAARANVALSTVSRVYKGTASDRSYIRVVEAARQLELPLPPPAGNDDSGRIRDKEGDKPAVEVADD